MGLALWLLLATQEAPLEDQLRELGYRLVHTSSINVINGLNLSRDQAVKLRDLARSVEEDSGAPSPRGRSPSFAGKPPSSLHRSWRVSS